MTSNGLNPNGPFQYSTNLAKIFLPTCGNFFGDNTLQTLFFVLKSSLEFVQPVDKITKAALKEETHFTISN